MSDELIEKSNVKSDDPRGKSKAIPIIAGVAVLSVVVLGIWTQYAAPLQSNEPSLQHSSPYHVTKPHRKPLVTQQEMIVSVEKSSPVNVSSTLPQEIPSTSPPPSQPLNNERLTSLETMQHDQNQTIAELSQQVQTLKEQLKKREKAEKQHLSTLRAFIELREKVETSQPFDKELISFLQSSQLPEKVRKSVSYLSTFADEGIASMDTLRREFAHALTRFYQEDNTTNKKTNDETMSAGFSRWAQSLVTIRKVGVSHQEKNDEDILARAEAYLAGGDLSRALEEVTQLSVHATPYFNEWHMQATARKESERMLQQAEQPLLHGIASE
jgi:hypothetical protein